MKKLVLFATIFAAVALTACNKKQEAPATESAVEEKTEVVTEPVQDETPADSASVETQTPAAQ